MIKPAELKTLHKELSDIVFNTEKFFNEDSPLRNSQSLGAPPYEERPQQRTMALKIAEALEKGKNLCVEAPTGIGKSYAYLVPSVFMAKSSCMPVLISTETINLQEQLLYKDIPILQQLIPGSFKAALAKGRSHYLCLRRLHFAMQKLKDELIEDDIARNIKFMAEWISDGGSGEDSDRERDWRSWDMICCEPGNCMGPKCKHFKECIYWKARKKWDEADIVVANHALLFTNIKIADLYEYSLLPEYSALVFDEAHTIENEAASHCGIHITKGAFEGFLKKLYDPDKAKGLLLSGGTAIMEARGVVSDLLKLSSAYFKQFTFILEEKEDNTFRFKTPGLIKDLLSEEIMHLAKIMDSIEHEENDDDAKQEISALKTKIEAIADAFRKFTCMGLDNHVYWAESPDNSLEKIELYACPLNIKEILSEKIFNSGTPCILASATLSVKNSLDYFCSRIGYDGGDKIILDTVFDYKRQMKIYISKNVPPPEDENYINCLSEEILKYLEKTKGKAFVLFTNYKILKACATELKTPLLQQGIRIIEHGNGTSRRKMIEEFKKDINSVIFGAASFWSGVDVPGESLSSVIITKLPFPVPSHPLIEARGEELEKKSLSSFRDYLLPEAVLRFRQGIGRLIRTKTDTGIIVILDNRIISKNYGKTFLNSIPECEIIFDNLYNTHKKINKKKNTK